MPYCFVKGGIDSYDCYVSSLSKDEVRSLMAEFKCSLKDVDDKNCNKAAIKLPGPSEPVPFKLVKSIKIIEPANFMINVLERKYGYKVVTTVGDDPTIWTMHRPSSATLAHSLSSGNLVKDLLKHTDSREKLLIPSNLVVNSELQQGLPLRPPTSPLPTRSPSPIPPSSPPIFVQQPQK